MTAVDWFIATRPFLGERHNGDLAFVNERDGQLLICVLDGLGHGIEAYRVAQQARELLQNAWDPNPGLTLRMLHDGLLGSRGAVGGVGVLDVASGRLAYAAVGNVVARLVSESGEHRFLPRDGLLGERFPGALRVQHEVLGAGDVLLVYTDGIQSGFALQDYPEMRAHTARSVAKILLRRFGSNLDDATCLAVRYER